MHTRLRTHAESIAFFGGGPREGRTVAAYFDTLTVHLRHVANIKWMHSVADDFFTKQLPFNVTWVLTLMYALDQGEVADDPVAQVNNFHVFAVDTVTNAEAPSKAERQCTALPVPHTQTAWAQC